MEYQINAKTANQLRNQLICKITGKSLAKETGYSIHPIFILDNKSFLSRFRSHLKNGTEIEQSRTFAISAVQRMGLLVNPYQPITCHIGNISNLLSLYKILRIYLNQPLKLQDRMIRGVNPAPKVGSSFSLQGFLPALIHAAKDLQTEGITERDLHNIFDAESLIDSVTESRKIVSDTAKTFSDLYRNVKAKKRRKQQTNDRMAMPEPETLAALDLTIPMYSRLVALYKMKAADIQGRYKLQDIEELYNAVRGSEISSDQEMDVLVIEVFLKNILQKYVTDLQQYEGFSIDVRIQESEDRRVSKQIPDALSIQTIELSHSVEESKPQDSDTKVLTIAEKLAALKSRHGL